MIRQDANRIEAKRRTALNASRKQFATKAVEGEYAHRLNFYRDAPKGDITLEQFEQWAIDRLRGVFSFPPPPDHLKTMLILQCSPNSKPANSETRTPPRQPRT